MWVVYILALCNTMFEKYRIGAIGGQVVCIPSLSPGSPPPLYVYSSVSKLNSFHSGGDIPVARATRDRVGVRSVHPGVWATISFSLK